MTHIKRIASPIAVPFPVLCDSIPSLFDNFLIPKRWQRDAFFLSRKSGILFITFPVRELFIRYKLLPFFFFCMCVCYSPRSYTRVFFGNDISLPTVLIFPLRFQCLKGHIDYDQRAVHSKY